MFRSLFATSSAFAAAAVVIVALTGSPAEARPYSPAAAPSAESRTFKPADFARFAPQNALDMLNHVPGFTIRAAPVERGPGEATVNVLLNGEPISSKSDHIFAQLQRVPASNVARIEIRDGVSGQVANVVVKAALWW
jgi:hypothetical protein